VRPRPELHRRIEVRLEAMLEAGLEAEARRLYEAGWTLEDPGLDTIGYREWWPCFKGRASREDAVRKILAATRAYAKRQETWFRNQGDYLERAPEPETVIGAWQAYLKRDGR
jgi:tRNA dimethylallyltransferase